MNWWRRITILWTKIISWSCLQILCKLKCMFETAPQRKKQGESTKIWIIFWREEKYDPLQRNPVTKKKKDSQPIYLLSQLGL